MPRAQRFLDVLFRRVVGIEPVVDERRSSQANQRRKIQRLLERAGMRSARTFDPGKVPAHCPGLRVIPDFDIALAAKLNQSRQCPVVVPESHPKDRLPPDPEKSYPVTQVKSHTGFMKLVDQFDIWVVLAIMTGSELIIIEPDQARTSMHHD